MAMILALLCALTCKSGRAAQWVEVGSPGKVALDRMYLDVDSLVSKGGVRTGTLLTVYEKIHLTAQGERVDRHTQTTAFDCEGRRFWSLRLDAYAEGTDQGLPLPQADARRLGSESSEGPLNDRLIALACPRASPGAAGRAVPSGSAGASRVLSGSGVVLNTTGQILTNHHVVSSCRSIAVRRSDGKQAVAEVEMSDPKNDLALLRTNLEFTEYARFRVQTEPIRIGESIGVVGYPLTGVLSSEPKATFGQVNSVAGMANDFTLMQISAPIQSGSSGSPVFDSNGSVVGIVVSQAPDSLATITGAAPQNVNFAIRGELAQMFIASRGVTYAVSSRGQKLATEEIAQAGRAAVALVLCDAR